jgi:hypothetical protein
VSWPKHEAEASASRTRTNQELDPRNRLLPVPEAEIGDLERLVILGLATQDLAVDPTASALPIGWRTLPPTTFFPIPTTFCVRVNWLIKSTLTTMWGCSRLASIHAWIVDGRH